MIALNDYRPLIGRSHAADCSSAVSAVWRTLTHGRESFPGQTSFHYNPNLLCLDVSHHARSELHFLLIDGSSSTF